MAWNTPATWIASAQLLAAQLNAQLRDNWNAAFPLGQVDGGWLAYTPVLTAVTTSPTLGSGGTATGRYYQVGKTVHGWAKIKFGSSGTAAGSGQYLITLPVAPFLGAVVNLDVLAGTAMMRCAAVFTMAQVSWASATQVSLRYTSAAVGGTSAVAGATTPGAWGASDYIEFNFVYEAA